MASRNNTFVNDKFSHMVDPKDGYPIRNCRDVRHRRLLEFILPIIHLDKPIQVMITIGNTIFGALDGGRLEDWRLVFQDLAQNLVVGARKTKSTSICLFIFHLYHNKDILTKEEDTDYRAAQELISHKITPNPESK